MGRYFLYRMHPFSVAETVSRDLPDPKRIVRQPGKPRPADFEALWRHGGSVVVPARTLLSQLL